MTQNDAQIEVLLRRYARNSQGGGAGEHPDADELNAFAEGALPMAARTRFVTHLADCDDCRRLATQLAIAAGATTKPVVADTVPVQAAGWWSKLGLLFAPSRLRYAAFAAVLVAAVGVTFIIIRERGGASYSNQDQLARSIEESSKAPEASHTAPQQQSEQEPLAAKNSSPVPPGTVGDTKLDQTAETKSGAGQGAGLVEEKPSTAAGAPAVATPEVTAKKALETDAYKEQPAYAPPPAAEKGQIASRAQRDEPDTVVATAPRKTDGDFSKFKMEDRSRAGEMPKDVRTDDERNRTLDNQNVISQNNTMNSQRQSGPRLSQQQSSMPAPRANRREGNEQAAEGAGRDAEKRAKTEEAPETRTAGGRKFRRQGSAWIDVNLKSSMSVINVSRDSDEYGRLDSGLRSIADQIGGDVTIVWKGKAYRIR